MIIGLSGRFASGKGTVGRYLAEKGFDYVSLSEQLREELGRLCLVRTRENLVNLANEIREEKGSACLAETALKRMDGNRNYVVDSIHHPEEAAAFKRHGNFSLLWIECMDSLRFERAQKRARPEDPKTFEEFRKWDDNEWQNSGSKQQLKSCKEMADVQVTNNGSEETLRRNVDEALRHLPQFFARPSWDHYFMAIAQVVASRSNCVKRKVASVIVKDKRVISTGYNGTPRGTKNCNEGGCPRCNSFTNSGERLEECLCSHGEENAIVQASYHGISLQGSTLYSTLVPCLLCSKMVINAGIARVVYNAEYPLSETAKRLLEEAGVELVKLEL